MITDVTIISTNLNRKLLNKYPDYHVIDQSFKLDDLLQYSKIIFFNILNNLEENKVKEIFKFLDNHNIKYINITNIN